MDKENIIYISYIIYMHTHLHILHIYYIFKYYSAIEKEGNSVICNNMDKPRGYYGKWDKSDAERQILYDLIYTWSLKKSQTCRTRE